MRITVLRSGSKGNCYHLAGSGSPLLLEAGIPFREIREGTCFGLSQLAGCLVTHEHGDHAKSVKDLVKAEVDVYATKGTLKALGLESHRLHAVKMQEWFAVGEWHVRAFPTIHDAEEPCGFLICQEDERLLYLTDTAYSPFRFKGLTAIMLEANYDPEILKRNVEKGLVDRAVMRRVIRSHMSIGRAKELLRVNDLSKVREIIIIHASDDNSNVERFKQEIQRLTGKVVRIG